MNETSGDAVDSYGSLDFAEAGTGSGVSYTTGGVVYNNVRVRLDTDSYFATANTSSFPSYGSDSWFSVAMWVYATTLVGAAQVGIGQWDGSSVGWYLGCSYDGYWVAFHQNSLGGDGARIAATEDQWAFLVAKFQLVDSPWPYKGMLSLDGGAFTTWQFFSAPVSNAGTALTVFANQSNGNQLESYMGPISAWNREITDDDVDALYNSGSGITYEDYT